MAVVLRLGFGRWWGWTTFSGVPHSENLAVYAMDYGRVYSVLFQEVCLVAVDFWLVVVLDLLSEG